VEQTGSLHVYKKRIENLEKALERTTNLLAFVNIDEKDVKTHNLVSNHVERCRYLLKAAWRTLAG